jgi:hypothetical protein
MFSARLEGKGRADKRGSLASFNSSQFPKYDSKKKKANEDIMRSTPSHVVA